MLGTSIAAILFSSCIQSDSVSIEDQDNQVITVDLTNYLQSSLLKSTENEFGVEIVRIKGKVRYFGLDILQNPPQKKPLIGIPDVHVWIAEYPFTKLLNIRTDDNGIWEILILKPKYHSIDLSFAYQKDFYKPEIEGQIFPGGLPQGWNTTLIRSNDFQISSKNITDIAAQMPDELFLYYAKTSVEKAISAKTGVPYTMNNIIVATIGKSWSSIYDSRLPHGDPGAIALVAPTQSNPMQGPIYFDENVSLNPALTQTSVDGGIMFNNLPEYTHTLTAQKLPHKYDNITFKISKSFNLYIASPPHSIQGTNSSGPGEW